MDSTNKMVQVKLTITEEEAGIFIFDMLQAIAAMQVSMDKAAIIIKASIKEEIVRFICSPFFHILFHSMRWKKICYGAYPVYDIMRKREAAIMKIVVIGAGASGMVAAITAARKGAEVVLFEKEERVGKKLLATGNGKCNYSNEIYTGSEYHCSDLSFVQTVLSKVTVEDTLEFFKELGVWPRVLSEGRIYPYSEQASSVLDALRTEIKRLKIEVICEHWIKGMVRRETGGFNLVSQQNMRLRADKVILACGGRAGAQYGCDGDGHAIAEMLDHRVEEPVQALVQLTSDESYFKHLKGVRSKGQVSLVCKGDVLDTEVGEIQFTEFGLSGICVFNLSGMAMRQIKQGEKVFVRIDLFPEIQMEELYQMMQTRWEQSQDKTLEEFLNGLVHKKVAVILLKLLKMEKLSMLVSDIKQEELNKLSFLMKNWNVPIQGSKGWNEAQTTSGGIVVEEIDPETMESKILQDLFFSGEVIDVDGKCGGYNLQWAWSSGILAGKSAAE